MQLTAFIIMAANKIVIVRSPSRFKFSTLNTPKTGHRNYFKRRELEIGRGRVGKMQRGAPR